MLPQAISNPGYEAGGKPALMLTLLGHMRSGLIQGTSLPKGRITKVENTEKPSTGSTGERNSKFTASASKDLPRKDTPPQKPLTQKAKASNTSPGRVPRFSMKQAWTDAKAQILQLGGSRAAAAGATPKAGTSPKVIAGPAKPGLAQGGID